MRRAHPVPKVGDTVVLNDCGLEQIFGRKLGLAHMKSLRMRITHVDSESLTSPEPTYAVEVDNPEINAFLVDHWCFDVVEQASAVRYEAWESSGGRSGIQRTLDPADQADRDFLEFGIRMVDAHGNTRPLSFKEAEQMGVRRSVAARDIRTGEMKWRE
jgi:hypothetical protein